MDIKLGPIPRACGGPDQSTVSSACTERPGCVASSWTEDPHWDQDAGNYDQHAAPSYRISRGSAAVSA